MILGESYPKDNKLKMEWNETMCKKKNHKFARIRVRIDFELEKIIRWTKKIFNRKYSQSFSLSFFLNNF